MAGLRVLHLGKYYPPDSGGMETYLQTLLETQRLQGIDARAIVHGTPRPEDPSWLVRVPTHGTVLHAPIAPGFRQALRAAIRQFSPDVLHIHMPNTSAFWMLTLASTQQIPWVIHWHSDVLFQSTKSVMALAYSFYKVFERSVLERAKRIIVTSPNYLNASRPLQPWRSKCVTVPLGLNPDVATATPDPAAENRLGYWRTSKFRVLSVGRLTYYKRFETLIRAVSELPDVELIIAGDGELRSELESLILELTPPGDKPATRLLGKVSEAVKTQLFAECDLFCLASCERTEAFGMVLLEAMQHRKPCLVSNLPGSGMPWVVQTSRCGELVPLNDIKAWRTAIAGLQHDPNKRQALGEHGHTALLELFDIRRSSVHLAEYYHAICPERQQTSASERLLIVIPAKDESASISGVVARLRTAGYPHIVVVNDQSTDNTATLAAAEGAAVLSPPLPLGAWGAMQTGIRFALRHGFTGVVTMDADGQHEISEIPSLLAQAARAEVVIGACPERGSPARKLAWAWFRKLTGFSLEDLTSGFRYYDRTAMELLTGGEATLLDYQDVGVLLMLRRHSMRIVEVPVAMSLRSAGKSRIFYSWLAVASYMLETSLLCLARWSSHAVHRKHP